MGRTASGVRGIRLGDDNHVVGVVVLDSENSILTVTENGYGKRSAVEEYPVRKRGGKGVFAIKASERNGKIIGAMQVKDEDEIMMITNGGKIIRITMEHMRVIGRNTQGVGMFNLGKGEKVVAMDLVAESFGDDEEGGENGENGENGGNSETDQNEVGKQPEPPTEPPTESTPPSEETEE